MCYCTTRTAKKKGYTMYGDRKSLENSFHRMRAEKKSRFWTNDDLRRAQKIFFARLPWSLRLWYTLVGVPSQGSLFTIKYFGWVRFSILVIVVMTSYFVYLNY